MLLKISLDKRPKTAYTIRMSDQESLPILCPSQSGPPKVHHISKQDKDIVDTYIQTGSIFAAAKHGKVSCEYTEALLSRQEIAEYVSRRFLYAAHQHDLSENKVMSKINEILDTDGHEKFDPSYLKALDLAARILKMIQPNAVNIGVNINNNPLSEASDEELDKMLLERMGHNKKPEIIISAEQAG